MAKKNVRNIGEAIREIKRDEVGRVFSALRQEEKSETPAMLAQEEYPKATPFSLGSYQPTEGEREILTLLAQGEQEIARGEGYDLDDVLKEADSLLLLP